MDPVRFDRLAKFAARRPSRRALLGVLGAGLLTALAGREVPSAAADECGAAFGVCLAHAHAAFMAAVLACGADADCVAHAQATYGTAVTVCQRADERCRRPATCALACNGELFIPCGPLLSDCTCACGVDGQSVCKAVGTCLNDAPCRSDDDCSTRGYLGQHCIRSLGCGTGTACVPPCA